MINNIGFMQGRLSEQIEGKIQAFPKSCWEAEFCTAAAIGMNVMEWTIDHDLLCDNPIMTDQGRIRISKLSNEFSVKVPSLTGDCFMQAPFWKAASDRESGELKKTFLSVVEASARIGIKIIVVPLVDGGRLENKIQELQLVGFLNKQAKLLQEIGVRIAFESDYSPTEMIRFMNSFPDQCFGVNYDTGNSASYGFDPFDELAAYGPRIINVHIKDRLYNGATVPLGTGAAKLSAVIPELIKRGYRGNFILQTARSVDGKHADLIRNYRETIYKMCCIAK
jgi:L-ribulose-5-phosphate 3-epimerase